MIFHCLLLALVASAEFSQQYPFNRDLPPQQSHELESAAIEKDLAVAETKAAGNKGAAVVGATGFKKADVSAFAGGVKGVAEVSVKSGKAAGVAAGKAVRAERFKKSAKGEKFGAAGRKFAKFGKQSRFGKKFAAGFNKKFGTVKKFGLNQGFKIGKAKGFGTSSKAFGTAGKKGTFSRAAGAAGFKKGGKKPVVKTVGDKAVIKSFGRGDKRSKKGGTAGGNKLAKNLVAAEKIGK